jgi:hypothetical protein
MATSESYIFDFFPGSGTLRQTVKKCKMIWKKTRHRDLITNVKIVTGGNIVFAALSI